MGSARLIINSNWCKQNKVVLGQSELRIGRTPDNDIVFTNQCVSRSHAVISYEQDHYVIEDKRSKHGTFVNKQRITRQQLRNNDLVHLGLVKETEMRFIEGSESDTFPGLSLHDLTMVQEKADFKNQELQMLLAISKALNSTLVLQDVLNLVMDAVIQLTQAQHGFLMLFNDQNDLEFKVARNINKESLNEDEFKVSRTIVNQVALSGEPLISGNIQLDDQFKSQQSVLELQVKTVMCVPLKIVTHQESRIIGVIYVHNTIVTPTFSRKTLDLLDYMASHAAIAIENARHMEATRIKERMQRELEIAYTIQTSLLPQVFPEISGLKIFARSIPAAEVGGDFYNFVRLSDRKVAIAIGDVIGKSIPAALYMSSTYSILETLLAVKNDLSPHDIIGKINAILCHQRTRGSNFVTFIYGILDLVEMTFTFSNAGHNYPILLRQGKCRELECTGPALGMFDEDQYADLSEHLQPGDTLVLYTDGIIEALNSERTMFGFNRLLETMAQNATTEAQDLGHNILEQVNLHIDDQPQFDDMTLLCLQLQNHISR
ncbi:SpoIIE family protein phosphatase [bacterium]|nr:SpoIIE family protein phosphatase [bacterium]